MREFDWSATSLGPVAAWPATLKTAVRILLDCKLPMYLAWGEERLQFFNDAYLPILGDKAREALGNRADVTWQEIWPTIGRMWAEVMQGRPVGADNFRLTIDRYGFPEDCYFSFSYSPVPGLNGSPAGILVTFAETTKTVMAERRQSFQLRLADTLRDQPNAHQLIEAASTLAGEYFGVDRTGYAEINTANRTVSVERDWTSPGFASLAGETRPLDSFGPALIEQLHNGHTLVIGDVRADDRSLPYADGYASIGVTSIVAVPLHEDATLQGIFYLHGGQARRWTQEDIELAEDVARRIADAVRRVRVEERLREETSMLELLNETGQLLNSTLDFDALIQSITDSATKLAGAEIGAFFHIGPEREGAGEREAMMLYTLSGARKEVFDALGHPRATAVFGPTFLNQGTVRSDNILDDPRYGRAAPFYGMPAGHPPVRSYLAVCVASKSGTVLGGLFFGHSAPGRFTDRIARLIEGVAAQAATAIDNARLYDSSLKAARERETLLVSERSARAEAERLGRAKDEFLAMLAHELRNPLAPVSASAQLLRMEGVDMNTVRRTSEVITRQVRHLTDLINDLMDVSRVTRGLVKLTKEGIDVAPLVATAVEQVRPLIDARQHQLAIRMNDQGAQLLGDRTRLIQVIANLLNNAAKYTAPGGAIALEVTRKGDVLELQVTDNGVGIEPALLPHVFELFTQGPRALDRAQGGLGIGLALVKAIVLLHDGAVAAYSAGAAQGSRFTVTLPCLAAGIADGLPLVDEAGAGSRLVMIVDDNVDAGQSLAMLLQALGHRVLVESNAADALRTAEVSPPDVFILDIGLPDMSGYELARRVRAIASCRSSILIALTGYGLPQDREMALAAGFGHHLVKPVDTQVLLKILGAS